jgi:hypothetical protein
MNDVCSDTAFGPFYPFWTVSISNQGCANRKNTSAHLDHFRQVTGSTSHRAAQMKCPFGGQTRHFDRVAATSGLPLSTDISRPAPECRKGANNQRFGDPVDLQALSSILQSEVEMARSTRDAFALELPPTQPIWASTLLSATLSAHICCDLETDLGPAMGGGRGSIWTCTPGVPLWDLA